MTVRTIVLVAEDNADLAELLQITLESAGYAVSGPFARANDAIASLSTTLPHIALLDYQLEGGTSEALSVELRSLGVPLIVMSGTSTEQLPNYIAGLFVIRKPCTNARLLHELSELLKAQERARD